MVIEFCTAAFICVQASSVLCKDLNVCAKLLASLLEEHGCAAVPSVHALADLIIYLPIANPSNNRVEIAVGTVVVTHAPVAVTHN